ncbi:hypothetical protein AVEN_17263-1 [Araneus ventricosus]|uniref:Uncharacterized protein n=1 Tax=Araneus ventricosus TaxID=182803 RepID=A0A4Y2LZ17_ARAVE|nr:hypothetical protein AVEN_17263-1 [Araneus ventricosus]
MYSEAQIDEAIQKFTCCITSAINISTRTKVISGTFRQLPKGILSKLDSENSTKLLSSHHTKEKPTNFKKKSERTLKPMTIIDGKKQLWHQPRRQHPLRNEPKVIKKVYPHSSYS